MFFTALVGMAPSDKAAVFGGTYYHRSSGDKIQISVYGENDLSIGTELGDGGVANYPFLGELKVAGLAVTRVLLTLLVALSMQAGSMSLAHL
ncbi:polysaccharide biosynthesis/export family protein [Microbulbifer sp. SAOS-129_SWC]|uniref:polysaccharide biosynthesis/export family protein n=1 Tax=Microbulbifer sp. SAOS-129_SWC TaxID=3145235 RepID=UPI00321710FB